MTRFLIELIGAQPVTNLLSIRYLQPEAVLFVGTREWHQTSQHLQNLVGKEVSVYVTEVHNPYNPGDIYTAVNQKIKKLGWALKDITFNLSGGTRMMAFAAYHAALDGNTHLADLEFFNGRYHIRLFNIQKSSPAKHTDEPLPTLLTLSDYLHAHLPGFDCDGFSRDKKGAIDWGGDFEQILYHTLEPHVDEILAGVRPQGVAKQIEIDLIIRNGNNVGLVEAKTGANKAGIDQLDTAGNPLYLGNHLVKFLITGRYLSRAHKSLAMAQQVQVIELPNYQHGRSLPPKDKQHLLNHINSYLPPTR